MKVSKERSIQIISNLIKQLSGFIPRDPTTKYSADQLKKLRIDSQLSDSKFGILQEFRRIVDFSKTSSGPNNTDLPTATNGSRANHAKSTTKMAVDNHAHDRAKATAVPTIGYLEHSPMTPPVVPSVDNCHHGLTKSFRALGMTHVGPGAVTRASDMVTQSAVTGAMSRLKDGQPSLTSVARAPSSDSVPIHPQGLPATTKGSLIKGHSPASSCGSLVEGFSSLRLESPRKKQRHSLSSSNAAADMLNSSNNVIPAKMVSLKPIAESPKSPVRAVGSFDPFSFTNRDLRGRAGLAASMFAPSNSGVSTASTVSIAKTIKEEQKSAEKAPKPKSSNLLSFTGQSIQDGAKMADSMFAPSNSAVSTVSTVSTAKTIKEEQKSAAKGLENRPHDPFAFTNRDLRGRAGLAQSAYATSDRPVFPDRPVGPRVSLTSRPTHPNVTGTAAALNPTRHVNAHLLRGGSGQSSRGNVHPTGQVLQQADLQKRLNESLESRKDSSPRFW